MSDGASAERREVLVVAALTLLPLLPFLGKAWAIDAPVFVAVAEQILRAPLDPFGFQMYWDATSLDAAEFNRNPPLLSYWIAPWLALSGGAEWVVRLACLPIPVAAALSFLGIARRLGPDAFGATALLVTTPAFVVLASSLLLDVPMLAASLFGVYALLRGVEPGHEGWLWVAGAAAGAAVLSKYAGLAAAPLLAAGAWLLAERRGRAVARVLLPWAAILCAWAALTYVQNGAVHFLGSTDVVIRRSLAAPVLIGQLTAIPIWYGAALGFPVALWGRAFARGRGGAALAIAAILLGGAVALWILPWGEPLRRNPPGPEAQIIAALGCAGGLFLWTSLLDPRHWWPEPIDRFLALWAGGWLVFSSGVNWHVNAADALLAAPPALLLLFRRAQLRPGPRFARGCAAATLLRTSIARLRRRSTRGSERGRATAGSSAPGASSTTWGAVASPRCCPWSSARPRWRRETGSRRLGTSRSRTFRPSSTATSWSPSRASSSAARSRSGPPTSTRPAASTAIAWATHPSPGARCPSRGSS
jgi:4-amino-4-deoxy-L-arabinose transferase-like glycosyltransferase